MLMLAVLASKQYIPVQEKNNAQIKVVPSVYSVLVTVTSWMFSVYVGGYKVLGGLTKPVKRVYTYPMTLLTKEEIDAVVDEVLEGDRRPLTEQEQNFIRFYAESLNKKLSYERAFLDGGTDPNGTTRANEILSKPEIGRRVAKLMQQNLDSDVSRSPNLLLKYIERYLELDPANYYNDDGSIIKFSDLSTEARLLISNINKQINNRTGQVVLSYALPDKIKLLDHLVKLVAFVTQVRALAGDTTNMSAEAQKKRDAIFAMNPDAITQAGETIVADDKKEDKTNSDEIIVEILDEDIKKK